MFIVKKILTRKENLVQVAIVCKNIPYEFIGHAELEENTDSLIALQCAETLAMYRATKCYDSFLLSKGVPKVVYEEGTEQESTGDK